MTDDTIVGAGATALSLQLSVSGEVGGAASASGNLNLLQVSNASGQTWLGVEATELNFDLNFAPLTLAVTNGSLKLNQKPVGQDKLDWAAIMHKAGSYLRDTMPAISFNASLFDAWEVMPKSPHSSSSSP